VLLALRIPRPHLSAALRAAEAAGSGAPAGVPTALAPTDDRGGTIGEVDPRAAAHGITAGMRVGEALVRCPSLCLLPPDPDGVRALDERVLQVVAARGLDLETIADGRHLADPGPAIRLHGGLRRLVALLAEALASDAVRIGGAPTRFAALQASAAARRGPRIVAADAVHSLLAPLPVERLRDDGGIPDEVCTTLRLVGIDRLGGLAALDRIAVRDRFGPAGLAAHAMARGADGREIVPRPRTRSPRARLAPAAPLADSESLRAALRLLIDRALADPVRADRAPRRLLLDARLTDGGRWSRSVPLREPTTERRRLFDALLAKALHLPAPARSLELALEELTTAGAQARLIPTREARRDDDLATAVEQVRSTVGPDGILRVVPLEPDSRLPERRYGLTSTP
jgi:protein ImuB